MTMMTMTAMIVRMVATIPVSIGSMKHEPINSLHNLHRVSLERYCIGWHSLRPTLGAVALGNCADSMHWPPTYFSNACSG